MHPRYFRSLLTFLFWALPPCLGLAVELANRYYRALPTPWLYPALAWMALGLLFYLHRRWLFLCGLGLILVYGVWATRHFFELDFPQATVHYYHRGELETRSGELKLFEPLEKFAPAQGPYLSCYFRIEGLFDYLKAQPNRCAGLSGELQIRFYLERQGQDKTVSLMQRLNLRSFWNQPLKRATLRLVYSGQKIKKIEEVFEEERGPGRYEVVQIIERGAEGRLLRVLLRSDSPDYAIYDAQGTLIQSPPGSERTWLPAKIPLGSETFLKLPEILTQGPWR